MKTKIHAAAGAIALLTVSAFWLSTMAAELFSDGAAIAMVKAGILNGMLVLVPAMMVAGASGFSLGKGWRNPKIQRKRQRMKVIAANGLLVLLPSSFFLAGRAEAGLFDSTFMLVQAAELAAGAVNIALLSLNMRDGLSLRRKASPTVAQSARKLPA